MTTKDYEILARFIHKSAVWMPELELLRLTADLAIVLPQQNQRFKPEQFFKAALANPQQIAQATMLMS